MSGWEPAFCAVGLVVAGTALLLPTIWAVSVIIDTARAIRTKIRGAK